MIRHGWRMVWMLTPVLLAGGCGRESVEPRRAAPETAREAVLGLFGPEADPEPDADDVRAALGEEEFAVDPAAAMEAVGVLAAMSEPRVVGETALPGLGRTAVDVAASLPGGGTAWCALQAAQRSDGTWRIVSIRGPGADWPPRSGRGGSGLSVSAPPTRSEK